MQQDDTSLRTWALVAAFVLLLIAFAAILALSPITREAFRQSLPQLGRSGRGEPPPVAEDSVGEFEELRVTVTIPSVDAYPPEALRGCAVPQAGAILGVTLGRPQSPLIHVVHPDGPADQAGIRPGDTITARDGKPFACVISLLPALRPRTEPREVNLTLRRPKEPPAANDG